MLSGLPFFFLFFFLSLDINEIELQGEISHLSETRVILLNKKTCVRGRTGVIIMEEIAVRLNPNGEKSQIIA